MAREIVWTAPAERDRKQILKYWLEHNGSPTYSLKLFKRFNPALTRLKRHPYSGRPTDMVNIRVIKVDSYTISH